MQSLYPSPSTYFTIARRILRKLLPCLKGSRGMMALMNSLLLISLAGSTQSQKTSLKRSALGDSLHEVVTHLLVLDIGG